jgi:hypothetical protein
VKLLTPKYITEDVVKKAARMAIRAVMTDPESAVKDLVKRFHCHIVVLVPAVEDARLDDYPAWPNYPTQPHALYQVSHGSTMDWEHPYDDIARCKALQLWTGRNDDRTSPIPHLLFPGDTPFWGGVWRRGFVVTCSGFQPWFDKLISGITSDSVVALAHHAYENDQERLGGVDFLS